MRHRLPPLLPAAVLSGCAVLGCAGSPQEEPESLTGDYAFDVDRLTVAAVDGGVRVTGAPDSVYDSAEVWGALLETPATLATAPVAADGSFTLDVAGEADGRLRLHALTRFGVEPSDYAIDGDGLVPLTDCAMLLSLTEYRDFGVVAVGDERAAAVELINRCDEPLAIIGSRALAGTGAFDLDLAGLAALPAGASAGATLRFAPSAAGDLVDFVTIDLVDHPPFVLTLRGRAP